MHNTKEKSINHYTGTITFFFIALLTSFNSGFFPYSITGRLCAILWLVTFSLLIFAFEYLLNHINVENKGITKAAVNSGIWLLAALVLVLFSVFTAAV